MVAHERYKIVRAMKLGFLFAVRADVGPHRLMVSRSKVAGRRTYPSSGQYSPGNKDNQCGENSDVNDFRGLRLVGQSTQGALAKPRDPGLCCVTPSA